MDEAGDIVFSATEGPGLYHVYCTPYANGFFARAKQLISCTDDPSAWLGGGAESAAIPNATVE